MLKRDDELLMSVDTLIHLNDLERYCTVKTTDDAFSMGARFVHTFFDVPTATKHKFNNHTYKTRLKLLQLQL
jgi:hypothetical protein